MLRNQPQRLSRFLQLHLHRHPAKPQPQPQSAATPSARLASHIISIFRQRVLPPPTLTRHPFTFNQPRQFTTLIASVPQDDDMFQRALSNGVARELPPPTLSAQQLATAKHQSSLDAVNTKKLAQSRSSVVSYASKPSQSNQSTLQPLLKSNLSAPRTMSSMFASNTKKPGLLSSQPASVLGKRSSSGNQTGLLKALDNTPTFEEGPAPKRRESSPPVQLNREESLRKAIYFNEDDFDDDLDFDADDLLTPVKKLDVVVMPPNLAPVVNVRPQVNKTAMDSLVNHVKPQQKSSQSQHSQQKEFSLDSRPRQQQEFTLEISSPAHPRTIEILDDDEIPWSSSPIEHQQLTASAIARPSPLPNRSALQAPIKEEMAPPVKKSRKLPWPSAEERAAAEEQLAENPPAGFNSKRLVKGELNPKTPSQSKALPWNTTASALKIAHKDLKGRNTQKKTLSTSTETNPTANAPKRGKKKMVGWTMSEEQQRVVEMVVADGKSVFFTGSAGTGKSVLLREIITALRKKYVREQDRVAVTASTGLAACNIGGVTLHSFAGIGLGKESADALVKKVKRNAKCKQRWLRTKVLIIDEVSMVDGDLFDKLETVARTLKNNGRPFGGIQLIVTGDFFQLPPVPEGGRAAKFAFDATTWNTAVDHTIGLTHIFRQKDPVFAAMLNEMRLGKLSQRSIEAFKKLNRPIQYEDGLEATELFPTRYEVENANNSKLRQIQGASISYSAKDASAVLQPEFRDKLLANCMAPPNLELKKNAQVMLIKNLDETLVNGSLGKVVAFMSEKNYAIIAESGVFEDDHVEDEDLDDSQRMMRNKVRDLMGAGKNPADTSLQLPLVQFTLPDGTARRTLIQLESWKMELPTGEVQASRTQLPLILAWAISIHKAQGQTLERVKVDLGKVFEKGQAYVALSRATSQEGLQVMRFDPKKVMAHDKVRAFYESLYTVEVANVKKPMITDEEEAMLEEMAEWEDGARRGAYA